MKRTVGVVLSLGMLGGMSTIGFGNFDKEMVSSIYLPQNSWVIRELERKKQDEEEELGYKFAQNWKDKVSAGYTCVDSGVPNSDKDTISCVIQSSRGVGLSIPLEKMEGSPITSLYAGVRFEKPSALLDIVKAVTAEKAPSEAGYCEVEFYNTGVNFDTYNDEIEAMEKALETSSETDIGKALNINNGTKIYQVNMDSYTYGYILEDEKHSRLFWCCKAVNEFEKGKFYSLNSVLDAYKDYKNKATAVNSSYTLWI